MGGGVIRHVAGDSDSFTVVKNIVNLAHNKNMTVTAELISDERYFNIAKSLGCDLAQGFFLGKPAPTVYLEEKKELV